MPTLSKSLLFTFGALSMAFAQTPDETAIRKTALNYIEGWYSGDAARMESALHPISQSESFARIRRAGNRL